MAIARAQGTGSDAALAQIVVTAVADAAMEVGIGHGNIASVAVNGPWVAIGGDRKSDERLLTAPEGKFAMNSFAILLLRAKWKRDRGLIRVDESLLRGASLAELEDAAADGATVQRCRVARPGLVDGGAYNYRLRCLGRDLTFSCHDFLFLGGLRRRADRGLQTELELSLGSTDKRLEDLRVMRIEGDVAAGRIGEAFEDCSLFWFDGKEVTKLHRQQGQRASAYR